MDLSQYIKIVQKVGSRYFIVAGIAFVLFYILFRQQKAGRKIQRKFPENKDYLREICFSVGTILIFALVPLFLLKNDNIRPHTTFYPNISDYGWTWFFMAFPVMLILHDTYFYWMHRAMHHPKLLQ